MENPQTPKFSKTSRFTPGKADRFIPQRTAMDLDVSGFSLKENSQQQVQVPVSPSPSKEHYQEKLAHQLFDGKNPKDAKILAFKQKAPAPREGYQSQYKVLYSSNADNAPKPRPVRHIPQHPERVLDAPNVRNDYYLNVLDWSKRGVVSIALNDPSENQDIVYFWDSASASISKLTTSQTGITSVRFNEDGSNLAIGKDDGCVEVWDALSCQGKRRLAAPVRANYDFGRVPTVAWNNHLLSVGFRDGSVTLHDVRVRDSLVHFRGPVAAGGRGDAHEQEVCGMRWNGDGTQLATGGNDNRVVIWDLASQRTVHELKEHTAAVKAIAWCPWQKDLLATGGGTADRHIRFWNTSNGALLNSIDTQSQVSSLVWSTDPSCKEIVSGHGFSKNQLIVWKYPSLVKTAELQGHEERVLQMALGPDGQSVVSVGADETLRFWKIFESQAKSKVSNMSSASSLTSNVSSSVASKTLSHHLIR